MYCMKPEFGDKAIRLADGSLLGYKQKDPNMFLNASTIYYGASGTGKSVAITEQLYLLKDLIPRAVAFAPSESKNKTYTGIIPPNLIHPQLTRKAIKRIFDEQSEIAELYAEINAIENLRRVFQETKKYPETLSAYYLTVDKIRKAEENTKLYIEKLLRSENVAFADRKHLEADARKKLEDSIREIYKRTISDNQLILLKLIKEREFVTIIKYINLNPRLLLILDDCVEQIKAISGQIKSRTGENIPSVMDTIFTRGRHDHWTIIIAAQDDNLISTTMRKNSYFSIFTDGECATHFMNNKANSIMKQKQKKAMFACDAIFNDHSDGNYKKLVYYRLGKDDTLFTYMIADRYGPFKMCSPDLWKLCKKIEEKNKQKRKKFLEKFS